MTNRTRLGTHDLEQDQRACALPGVSGSKLSAVLVLAAASLLIGCGTSACRGFAGTRGGALLPASWGTGLYSACPADGGPGFSGVPGPNCRQGRYWDSRIPLPPGPWSITVYVPHGCDGGSNGEGGTLAAVPSHGWSHVEGVSAAACGDWSGLLPPAFSRTS